MRRSSKAMWVALLGSIVVAACASAGPRGDDIEAHDGSRTSLVGDVADPGSVDSDAPSPTRPATTEPSASDPAPDAADDEDRTSRARPGDVTLDDPYVGDFGNGGYDVSSYVLDIDWAPDDELLDGVTTITSTATHDLSAFNLELTGFEISSVEVDGEAADFVRAGDEVTILPIRPVAEGTEFDTVVAYSGTPVDNPFVAGDVGRPSGWHTRPDYVYVAGEPLAASTFHPVNDHPSDKASFEYRITAPSDLTVAASGTLESSEETGDTTTWLFVQPAPQTTYLTTILIGDFTVVDDGQSASGVPVRNVYPSGSVERLAPVFDDQPTMLDEFEELFGPYPFEVYGSAVVPDSFGGALETQTLSIYGIDVLGYGDAQDIVAHELAHQWFGNDVSLERWEDIWLNEGFATYAEALWRDAADPDFSYRDWIGELSRFGPALERHVHNPGPDDLFGVQVYLRGGLTLHALRLEVGDEVFFEILRTWNDRFGGGNATTDDFVDLAEELSGDDLTELFDAWIYSSELPDELDGVPLG